MRSFRHSNLLVRLNSMSTTLDTFEERVRKFANHPGSVVLDRISKTAETAFELAEMRVHECTVSITPQEWESIKSYWCELHREGQYPMADKEGRITITFPTGRVELVWK